MRKIIIITTIVVLGAYGGLNRIFCENSPNEEGILTLEEALRLGEVNNYEIQKRDWESLLDQPSSRVAFGRFLPSVTAQYSADESHFYNPTYLNPDGSVSTYPRTDTLFIPEPDSTGYLRYPIHPTIRTFQVPKGVRRGSNWAIRVEEILYDGGRNILGIKQARLDKAIREARKNLYRWEVRQEIVTAYCQVYLAQEKLRVAQQNVARRKLLLELANIRFETGSVTRRDVLQSEVELGRARNDSMNAALEWEEAWSRLNLTLGSQITRPLPVAPLPIPEPLDRGREELIKLATTEDPQIKTFRLQRERIATEIHSIKGEYHPVITLSLLHSRSEQSGATVPWTLDPRNRNTSINLNTQITIFDRFTRSLKVQDGVVRHRQAQIDEIKATESVKSQIEVMLRRLEAIQHQILVAQQNASWAIETLNFEEERYRLGAATIIEVTTAQSTFVQTQMELATLYSDYHIALAQLEKLVGTTLRSKSPTT